MSAMADVLEAITGWFDLRADFIASPLHHNSHLSHDAGRRLFNCPFLQHIICGNRMTTSQIGAVFFTNRSGSLAIGMMGQRR